MFCEIKRILVAPLNWGIGHATRCIPIIENLIKNDFDVLIATSGRPLQLLQKNFHILNLLNLKTIILTTQVIYLLGCILIQIPKLFLAIKKERRCLTKSSNHKKLMVLFPIIDMDFTQKACPVCS